MEKLIITIIEEKDTFIEALRYLNFLKINEVTNNEDILNYADQMLYNHKEEIHDDIDDEHFFAVDLEFRDDLHAHIICAFWNAVCADAIEKFPEIYEMAFKMYYGLVMAIEVAKEEKGGAI